MKDYKKILEGVVDIINTTEKSDIGFVNICSYIGENCPELKESEDERIRKEIKDFFSRIMLGQENFLREDYDWNAWIAWLEKQGEKPTEWSKEIREEFERKYNEGKAVGIELSKSNTDIEWSEEDEKMLDKMRDYFMRFLGDKPDFTDDKRYEGFVEFIDQRLKSLIPQK